MPVLSCSFYADADTPLAFVKSESSLQTHWPDHTDLVYADGSTKLYLMGQRPLVKYIIQDGIERVKASILCTDAFPDATLSNTFARDALILAADLSLPASRSIRARLVEDDDYIGKIICLVRAIMSGVQSTD